MTDLTKAFLSIFSGKVSTVLITISVTPLLARLLGSNAYGDYAFMLSVVGVSMILVNAGIYDGVRKFIAERRDDHQWVAHVFGFYLRLGIVLAAIAATILLVVTQVGGIGQVFGSAFESYFIVVAVLIVGRQLFQTTRGGLMGLGLETYSETLQVGRKLTFAVIALGLAGGWGVVGVLTGHVIASIGMSLLALLVLRSRVDVTAALAATPTDFPRRRLALFNLESIILTLLMASLYHVDVLLLNPIAGSQATGHYKAALMVAEFLWFGPFALQTALLHSSSRLWAEHGPERITTLSARVTRLTVAVTVLLTLGIAALVTVFVTLYFGQAFEPASGAVVLLLPGALGFAVARPIFAIGQGKGQLRPLIVATGVAAMLNLGLNLLLIPRYGMIGAGIATSFGYGSMLVMHIYAARTIGYDPLADLRLVRLLATVGVAAPVIFGLAWVVPPLPSLVVVPIAGGIVYSVAAVRFRLVDPDEIEWALDRLPPMIATRLRSAVGWIS